MKKLKKEPTPDTPVVPRVEHQEQLPTTLRYVEPWVHQRYHAYKFEFIYDRTVFVSNVGKRKVEYSFSELEDAFFLEAIQAGFKKQREIIKTVLRQILTEERRKHIKAMTDVVCKEGITEERRELACKELGDLLFYYTGQRSELDLAVMRHFLWQVKRKLMSLPVTYHMMPFWYGDEQGSGKSTAIRRLLEPLKDLYLEQTFQVFADSRRSESFERYYVLFLDEMGEASKADMSTVKGIITGERIGHRKLYQNDEVPIRVNTTLIGASNKRLSDLLKDDHMRRFWQINLQDKVLIVKSFPAIKALDYTLMWDSISHTDECAVLPYLGQIDVAQIDLTTKPLAHKFVEDWLDIGSEVEEKVDPNEIYEWFESYCRALGVEEGRWDRKATFLKALSNTPIIKVKSNGLMRYKAALKTQQVTESVTSGDQ